MNQPQRHRSAVFALSLLAGCAAQSPTQGANPDWDILEPPRGQVWAFDAVPRQVPAQLSEAELETTGEEAMYKLLKLYLERVERWHALPELSAHQREELNAWLRTYVRSARWGARYKFDGGERPRLRLELKPLYLALAQFYPKTDPCLIRRELRDPEAELRCPN